MNEIKMARPAQKLNLKKSRVGGSKLDQQITGILTSRIETRNIIHSFGQVFYYGFFKLNDQEQEIPVIFKKEKPNLAKGSQAQLTGQWANGKARPSFTCLSYELIKPDYQAKEVSRG